MRFRAVLMPAAVLGVTVMVLMGAQSCGKATIAASSGGVITYQGLGNPPAKSHPGEWLRTGNSNWIWAAAGAAAGTALGAWASNNLGTNRAGPAYAEKALSLGTSDPCYNYKGGDAHTRYKPADFVVTTFTGLTRGVRKSPYLDCEGLYKAAGDHGVPARLKSIADCILIILRAGTPIAGLGLVHYHLGEGVVGVDPATGRVVGARPAQGSWTKCARMTS